MPTDILSVIVGSQAHGLAGPGSDTDIRGVFVVPTEDLLTIGGQGIAHTGTLDGDDDNAAWELGKFLLMATKCNPTALEAFLAPVKESTPFGDELRALFPHVWNSVGVRNAFVGYGLNQRKKFFDTADRRTPKYATAYLRVLFNCHELLSTGTFSVDLRGTEVYEACRRFKAGEFTRGGVIDACWQMETRVLAAFERNPDKKTDLAPVNAFLLRVRRAMWSGGV